MNIGAESIRFHRNHLPLLLQLHAAGAVGPDAASAAGLEELRQAEVLLDDELHPMAAAMAEAISDSPLVISVERLRLGATAASTIWAAPHGAVIGSRIDHESFELKLASSSLLPFHIFQLIHLRPLPDAPTFETTVSAETMLAAEELVDAGDAAAALAALEAAGVAKPGQLVAIMKQRTASWRLHSVWSTSEGAKLGAASGIDCGALGHYLVTVDDDELHIRSARFKEVLNEIRGVLP